MMNYRYLGNFPEQDKARQTRYDVENGCKKWYGFRLQFTQYFSYKQIMTISNFCIMCLIPVGDAGVIGTTLICRIEISSFS